jgi:hypothetical protein
MIRAVEPKDEIEAMLAAQMAAVHMAAINPETRQRTRSAGSTIRLRQNF